MQERFSRNIRVYYEDTDAGGIVYYANYLKFFERVRSDWLRSLGLLDVDLRRQDNAMFVVHQATLSCHRPARLEDELSVDVVVASSRRASLVFHQQAHRATLRGRDLIAEADISIAYLDCTSMRPKALPPQLLQVLNFSPPTK